LRGIGESRSFYGRRREKRKKKKKKKRRGAKGFDKIFFPLEIKKTYTFSLVRKIRAPT